jgi:hypothetical protein
MMMQSNFNRLQYLQGHSTFKSYVIATSSVLVQQIARQADCLTASSLVSFGERTFEAQKAL